MAEPAVPTMALSVEAFSWAPSPTNQAAALEATRQQIRIHVRLSRWGRDDLSNLAVEFAMAGLTKQRLRQEETLRSDHALMGKSSGSCCDDGKIWSHRAQP